MRLRIKDKREYDDDGLLPLVNIIFLLLIFFMIAGVIEKKIVKDNLELPSAELSRFENKEVTKIYIDKDNNYFLNDTVTRNENIIIYIKEKKIKEVILIADKSLLINDISKLLNNLHKNNIKNIKLLSNRNAN
ncbi:MAG: biopolymer transporter ExbD [Gammaproteobacteria bacterium]|jgi:biopolymer transport protein ExbD|nr:biopolymer transporter ExbD [Gammaproteobacteria bacterium]